MILITAATNFEAKSIIDFYRLKKVNQHLFPIYKNSNIILLVTGIGKINSISAISFFFGKFFESKICGAINIGIAGHRQAQIGDIFLIHKVHDFSTERAIYPSIPFKWMEKSGVLTTFETPDASYSVETLIDMEGFFFYLISSKFLKIDVIHSLKIVSDNQENPIKKIKKQMVIELVRNKLSVIQKLIESILKLNNALPVEIQVDISPYIRLAHFTETEKITLKNLLERIKLIGVECDYSKFTKFKKSKEIINALKKEISNGYHLH